MRRRHSPEAGVRTIPGCVGVNWNCGRACCRTGVGVTGVTTTDAAEPAGTATGVWACRQIPRLIKRSISQATELKKSRRM